MSDLIERIRREADMSARPGQLDRLNAIADEVVGMQGRIARLVRTAENVAEWLARYSDQGQHRRLNGPSAGDAFDAAQSLRDAIVAMRGTAEKAGEG